MNNLTVVESIAIGAMGTVAARAWDAALREAIARCGAKEGARKVLQAVVSTIVLVGLGLLFLKTPRPSATPAGG